MLTILFLPRYGVESLMKLTGTSLIFLSRFAGSPNFGHRSVYRDLEAQMTIVTKSEALREALDAEQKNLFDSSQRVDSDTYDAGERGVPKWVRFVVAVARNFF